MMTPFIGVQAEPYNTYESTICEPICESTLYCVILKHTAHCHDGCTITGVEAHLVSG